MLEFLNIYAVSFYSEQNHMSSNDQTIIDTILSMLLEKWYVRSWFDGIESRHFTYIIKNINQLNKTLIKSSRLSNLLDNNDNLKPEETQETINLWRFTEHVSHNRDEEWHYNNPKPLIQHSDWSFRRQGTQKYYILFNHNRTTIEKIYEMYWLEH